MAVPKEPDPKTQIFVVVVVVVVVAMCGFWFAGSLER